MLNLAANLNITSLISDRIFPPIYFGHYYCKNLCKRNKMKSFSTIPFEFFNYNRGIKIDV